MICQHYLRVFVVLVWSIISLVCNSGCAQFSPADADTAPDFIRRGPGAVAPKPPLQAPTQSEAKPAELKPLNFQVDYVYRANGRGDLKPLTEGSVLHSGDYYKIQFTPTENCYVYIFQKDSSGKVYQLFPMLGFKGVAVVNRNPVRAGDAYHIPAKDKAFELDNQKGREAIYVLAFREPNQALEKAYQLEIARQQQNLAQAGQIEAKLSGEFTKRGLAGIVGIVQDSETQVPASGKQENSKKPVHRLKNSCAECISVVTFEHR